MFVQKFASDPGGGCDHPHTPGRRHLRSSLAEGAGHLIMQRLDDVLQRRALVRLDEHLCLHPGNEMQSAEMLDLLSGQGDADRLERGPCVLVRRDVRRDPRDRAAQLRRRA